MNRTGVRPLDHLRDYFPAFYGSILSADASIEGRPRVPLLKLGVLQGKGRAVKNRPKFRFFNLLSVGELSGKTLFDRWPEGVFL